MVETAFRKLQKLHRIIWKLKKKSRGYLYLFNFNKYFNETELYLPFNWNWIQNELETLQFKTVGIIFRSLGRRWGHKNEVAKPSVNYSFDTTGGQA